MHSGVCDSGLPIGRVGHVDSLRKREGGWRVYDRR